MPYVICSSCETTAYTAARFTTVDDCPLCGEQLLRGDATPLSMTAQWTAAASAGEGADGAERARSGLPFQSLNVPR